ncbi:MAG: hypothetical protein ACKOX3_06730 [Bacteroidota bacterium]
MIYYFSSISNKNQYNSSVFTDCDIIHLEELKNTNEVINELKTLCRANFSFNYFTLAVFGSIANHDSISYSDFDGILIYDEKHFHLKKHLLSLRHLISNINRIVHLQDALQHHGIIVIGLNELRQSNDVVITHLLKESKVISGKLSFEIKKNQDYNFQLNLERLTNSISAKLNDESNWYNQYFFKNMISELLLYPCLYLQATHQIYISKKDSFERLVEVFTLTEIELIKKIESIRINWEQKTLAPNKLTKHSIDQFKKNQLTEKEFIIQLKKIKSELSVLITSKKQ